MTMRILIAGGLGYVGGRVAQALVDHPGVQLEIGTAPPPNLTPTLVLQGGKRASGCACRRHPGVGLPGGADGDQSGGDE